MQTACSIFTFIFLITAILSSVLFIWNLAKKVLKKPYSLKKYGQVFIASIVLIIIAGAIGANTQKKPKSSTSNTTAESTTAVQQQPVNAVPEKPTVTPATVQNVTVPPPKPKTEIELKFDKYSSAASLPSKDEMQVMWGEIPGSDEFEKNANKAKLPGLQAGLKKQLYFIKLDAEVSDYNFNRKGFQISYELPYLEDDYYVSDRTINVKKVLEQQDAHVEGKGWSKRTYNYVPEQTTLNYEVQTGKRTLFIPVADNEGKSFKEKLEDIRVELVFKINNGWKFRKTEMLRYKGGPPEPYTFEFNGIIVSAKALRILHITEKHMLSADKVEPFWIYEYPVVKQQQ